MTNDNAGLSRCIAIVAAALFISLSAAINVNFAVSKAQLLHEQAIWTLIAIASDLLKAAALPLAFAAAARWDVLRTIASIAALGITVTYSLIAAAG